MTTIAILPGTPSSALIGVIQRELADARGRLAEKDVVLDQVRAENNTLTDDYIRVVNKAADQANEIERLQDELTKAQDINVKAAIVIAMTQKPLQQADRFLTQLRDLACRKIDEHRADGKSGLPALPMQEAMLVDLMMTQKAVSEGALEMPEKCDCPNCRSEEDTDEAGPQVAVVRINL